jgi:hypothetical protein
MREISLRVICGLAVERIRQWKFEPATRDGKPIRVMMPMEINFNLGGRRVP